MPVPAPATAELLKGVPTYADGPAVELATPTGAAIVTTLATEFGRMPTMRVQAVGNGAGEKEFEGRANFVRAMLGVREEATGLPVESRTLVILSTEIDDMSPELLAPVIGKLLESGAVDAHLEPIQMKKGRAGQRLVALAPPDRRDAVAERIFRETSTFGLKVQEATGLCLARRMDSVETPHGPVKVKVGLWGDDVLRVTPEFEDCHRLAEEKGVPLAAVHTAALAAICARWGTGSPITP
jgi:hypothetical protein